MTATVTQTVHASSPATAQSAQPSIPDLLHSLQTKGYCIIPSFLSAAELSSLRSTAANVTALARAGQWPHVRTLPKQFPPWSAADAKTHGIWGVQHLLHPDCPGRDEFARCYFDARLLDICQGLMRGGVAPNPSAQTQGEQLVMELFNLLVRPDSDFALRWHRDSVPFDGVSVEEEAQLLGLSAGSDAAARRIPHHVQYNIPLYADSSLLLVPSSHLRPRTAAELEALEKDRYAPELPNMMTVHLQPGDVVFYDNNVIHTGRYSGSVERMTLHGSVGDVRGGTGRAQNVLQHAVGAYIQECRFDGLEQQTRVKAEGMKANLVQLGEKAGVEGTRGIHKD